MSDLRSFWQAHECPDAWPSTPMTNLKLHADVQQRCESLNGRAAKRLQSIVSLCPA